MVFIPEAARGSESLVPPGNAEAIARYEEKIKADPTEPTNYWHLGWALLCQGEQLQATKCWETAIALTHPAAGPLHSPDAIAALETEALRWENLFDYPTAFIIRQALRELAPQNLNNLLGLVSLSLELDPHSLQLKRDLLHLCQLLSGENRNPDLDIHRLAHVLEKLFFVHPLQEFIDICIERELLQNHPQEAWFKSTLGTYYNNLGAQLYQQKAFEAAVSYFKKSQHLKSGIVESLELAKYSYNIGRALMGQRKFEEALPYLEESHNLNPNLDPQGYQLFKARYEIKNIQKGYEFTTDWFSVNIGFLTKCLSHLVGAPHIQGLEIGSWEGRSTCWFLERILTHETARITCIDTFQGSVEHQGWYETTFLDRVEERFDKNIAVTGTAQKVKKCVGSSQEVLRSLPPNCYDFLYIDGSHLACDVLADAILGWGLLKIGGILIFDDYDFTFTNRPNDATKIGIDGFLASYHHKYKMIYKENRVVVQKIAS